MKRELCVWVCVCVCGRSVMSDSVTPWTVACQAPLPMEFSRQEYWSGLLFPTPGDLPDPGMEPLSLVFGLISYLAVLLCCCCSVAKLCLTLCEPMDHSMPDLPVLHHLLELAQTHIHWVGDTSSHLILSCPLLMPLIFPSIRVFSNESAPRIKWLKYWSFSFSRGPSNEYSGLISLRIDWFDLLTVQGTLKSLLQHHDLKASILQRSAFFMVHLWLLGKP